MKSTFSISDRNKYIILFAAIILVYIFGMFIDVMEVDAAQYATISMEMSQTKSFLHVYEQGNDYLDKPPLLFWLSSLSFMIFGISNFAYKLPSVLIAILGIYSTYRFSLSWYSRQKSILSALILASSQALFLITNDVRTDTMLLGLTMFSAWQLNDYIKSSRFRNLLLSSIGIGFAMMAKGPIAIVVIALAFGGNFLLKREWRNVFKPQWLLLLFFVALTLVPMCYGLYTQFDMHPEKHVYGLDGPSGIKFFFWTQSFGRITGENYWSDGSGYLYFFHTILWDFQPWVLLFVPALIIKIIRLFKQKFKVDSNSEYISLCGFVLVFAALSFSNYKLPHYIFVIFPFASIITADFIYELKEKTSVKVARAMFGVMLLFWLLIVVGFILVFSPRNLILPLVLILAFFINLYLFVKIKNPAQKIFIPTTITIVCFNLMMALHFYPNLLQYQANSQAGIYVRENKPPETNVYRYEAASHSFDFYTRTLTKYIIQNDLADVKPKDWIYTDLKGLTSLENNNIDYNLIETFKSFRVTHLELEFLLKSSRDKTLTYNYLIEIK